MSTIFPGMDPYLEAPGLWRDLHQSLITYIRDDLQPQIRPGYRARIEERLYVVQTSRHIYPDVTVVRRSLRERTLAEIERPAEVELPEIDTPIRITLADDEIREPFIEIVHLDSGQVVTVIEVLSPANKRAGAGRERYLAKQAEVLHSDAHLVEIDLLSQGAHTIALPEEKLSLLPPHRYRISVCRGPEHVSFDMYPILLEQRLPRFRTPLRSPDPDVVVDLPAIFQRAYDNGGYADFVDYSQPPPVPLSAAEQQLLTRRLRSTAGAGERK